MTFQLKQLSDSLKKDGSDKNLRAWAKYIVENNIALADLTGLLDSEKPIPMRFSWLIGGLCELKPEVVFPAIPYFFSKRHAIQFPNFDRSLAKMFYLAGIPESLEGEAIDELFGWLMDANISVSTKHYALLALYNFTNKHPELRQELITVIEDQLDKNSAAWKKHAGKVLE